MFKKVAGFVLMSCLVLCMSVIVLAHDEPHDNNDEEYVFGQVTIEVFWTDTGEVVSREYFDVEMPIAELDNQHVGIESRSIMFPTTVWVDQNGREVVVSSVGTGIVGEHTRFVNFVGVDTVAINEPVMVILRTNATRTVIGSAGLRFGQSFRVTVPWNTVSYTVSVQNIYRVRGFNAIFSITI
ncbi:MAG: hypothetical protein FWE05_12575 [Defluviitaleaceae bacterium]|nr:hypothetical protein [Defluviitaleaceae bacterium]